MREQDFNRVVLANIRLTREVLPSSGHLRPGHEGLPHSQVDLLNRTKGEGIQHRSWIKVSPDPES